MSVKHKLNNHFNTVTRVAETDVADNFEPVKKRKNDNQSDHRIRMINQAVKIKRWKALVDEWLAQADGGIKSAIDDFMKDKDLKPYHFALICLYPKKYIKTWLSFMYSDILPSLNEREKIFFSIKTLLALREFMSPKQIEELLTEIYNQLTPIGAVLLNYYFPEYVKGEYEKIINNLIFEASSTSNSIERIVANFEKNTKEFFILLNKIIS